MRKLSIILKGIKKSITKKNWVQNEWSSCDTVEGVCTACLAGAVERYYGTEEETDYHHAIDVTAIPKLYIRNAIVKYTNGYFNTIIGFNDDIDTTFKDVQKVMDVAILQAKKDNISYLDKDEVTV